MGVIIVGVAARYPAGASLALAVLVLAACTSSPGSAQSPTVSLPTSRSPAVTQTGTTTARSTPTRSAAEQQAVEGAERAYRTYLALGDRAAQTGSFDEKAFREVSGDPALPIFYLFIKQNKKNGIVQRGTTQVVGITPISVDLKDEPPVVRLRACLDTSRRKLIFEANGELAFVPGKSKRVQMPVKVVYAKASGETEPSWLVIEASAGKDPKSC